jgi:hypothetical protein
MHEVVCSTSKNVIYRSHLIRIGLFTIFYCIIKFIICKLLRFYWVFKIIIHGIEFKI